MRRTGDLLPGPTFCLSRQLQVVGRLEAKGENRSEVSRVLDFAQARAEPPGMTGTGSTCPARITGNLGTGTNLSGLCVSQELRTYENLNLGTVLRLTVPPSTASSSQNRSGFNRDLDFGARYPHLVPDPSSPQKTP
jgi:hypothetical protein